MPRHFTYQCPEVFRSVFKIYLSKVNSGMILKVTSSDIFLNAIPLLRSMGGVFWGAEGATAPIERLSRYAVI